jgi:hypothetical protein
MPPNVFQPNLSNLHQVNTTALNSATKQSLHDSLKATLSSELSKAGITGGLKPGDTVAISSSIGQSISF